MNRFIQGVALLMGALVLAACSTLPERRVPEVYAITQTSLGADRAEYVFCDLKGGAWACEQASRKTPVRTRVAASGEPRASADHERPNAGRAASPTTLLTVFFEFNSARISSEQTLALIDLARDLKNASRIVVTGYTDNIGPEHFNGFLAQRRASAVKKVLIEQGIVSSHIYAFGKGKCCYIGDNRHTAGRANNRRVTIAF